MSTLTVTIPTAHLADSPHAGRDLAATLRTVAADIERDVRIAPTGSGEWQTETRTTGRATWTLAEDTTPRPIDTTEPPEGSVVLAHGTTGTAYQRFYSDGLWHGTNGRVLTWTQVRNLTTDPTRPPLLIHEAEEDE